MCTFRPPRSGGAGTAIAIGEVQISGMTLLNTEVTNHHLHSRRLISGHGIGNMTLVTYALRFCLISQACALSTSRASALLDHRGSDSGFFDTWSDFELHASPRFDKATSTTAPLTAIGPYYYEWQGTRSSSGHGIGNMTLVTHALRFCFVQVGELPSLHAIRKQATGF